MENNKNRYLCNAISLIRKDEKAITEFLCFEHQMNITEVRENSTETVCSSEHFLLRVYILIWYSYISFFSTILNLMTHCVSGRRPRNIKIWKKWHTNTQNIKEKREKNGKYTHGIIFQSSGNQKMAKWRGASNTMVLMFNAKRINAMSMYKFNIRNEILVSRGLIW